MSTKEVFVLPANSSLVGKLITLGDVTDIFTIFIDMIGPKWPRAIHKLARFSLETIVIPMRIGQSIYSSSTFVIALFCVHSSRGRYRAPFFVPPTSPQRRKPAALLRMRRNYFRPYRSIFACAIEVQHNNENSTTICLYNNETNNYYT